MAYYSINQYTGSGAPQLLTVPPYISKEHIQVFVDGVEVTSFTWINDNTIQLTATVGATISVERHTSPAARMVDFQAPVRTDDLDLQAQQNFYLAQEAADAAGGSGVGGGGGGGGSPTTITHTVRGPDGETLTALPIATTRANSWLKFNGAGNPAVGDPATAAFSTSTTYSAGSLGQALKDLVLGGSLGNWIRSATGAVTRLVSSKLSDRISVFDFMTAAQISDVSSNTASLDVTAAVQAFLNASKWKTGYLEPGKYKITASLTLDHTASYCIKGAGCDITFQSGTTLMPAMNAPCILIDNSGTDNYNPDIELSGFGICGSNAGTDQHGIYARRTPVDLKRLFIANCYHGVKLTYGYASTMHNCITANNYGHGVFLDRLANQITMLHCISNANSRSGGGFAGIAVIGSSGFENLGVTLINCDTTSNGYGAGTPAGTQGVGVQVGHSRGVALVGHYGEHNKEFGVYADVTVRALSITGGFFTQEELRLIDVKGLTVTGNQFEAYDATSTKLTIQGGSGYGCDLRGNSYVGGTHIAVRAFSRGAYEAVQHYATANPATAGWGGPWQVGDKVWNLSVADGAPVGWVCRIAGNEAGSTGDWIPFGKIDSAL